MIPPVSFWLKRHNLQSFVIFMHLTLVKGARNCLPKRCKTARTLVL